MNERNESSAEGRSPMERRARDLFDESVQGLDAATRSQLNRGRQAALAEAASGAGFQPLSGWVPAAGLAAAAVFAVVLWIGIAPQDELQAPAEVADFEILLNDDSFEMLQDLEFYSWIDMDAESGLSEGSNVG